MKKYYYLYYYYYYYYDDDDDDDDDADPFLVDSGRMFGQVYNPWERVTTSHHGSQVSLFLLLTGTVSLVSLLSPTMLFSG